jgi:hypothetical protein
VAAEEVAAKAVETAKVTAAPESGNSAPHGGTSGQPGLGDHVDVYATEAAKIAAEKIAQSLLGKEGETPKGIEPPSKENFPFLTLLGDATPHKTPGHVIDTTV